MSDPLKNLPYESFSFSKSLDGFYLIIRLADKRTVFVTAPHSTKEGNVVLHVGDNTYTLPIAEYIEVANSGYAFGVPQARIVGMIKEENLQLLLEGV